MSISLDGVSKSARVARYNVPVPLKLFLIVGMLIWMAPGLFALIQTHQYDVAAICFFLGGGLLLLLYKLNEGYRIGWDEERVYMREGGFFNILFRRKPFRSIAYNDMKGMEGRLGNNAAAKSRFMPYEYLEISSKDVDAETVSIYPLSIDAGDLVDLFVFLHGKRPDIFPELVLSLMRKDGLIRLNPSTA